MNGKKKSSISDIFPILLFLVFTLSALGIVLASVQIYQRIVEQANESYDTETAIAYLSEKFRSHDENGSIRKDQFKGHDAIVLEDTIVDVPYVTYIYAYDGYLRELFIEKELAEGADEDSGNRILEMKDFNVGEPYDRLMHLKFTDRNGKVTDTYLSVHSTDGRT